MEFVFVVERNDLFDLAYPQGFVAAADHRAEVETYLARARRHGFFIERRRAEQDSRLKQIIPYVVVQRGGDVLALQRMDSQGESRLHGKRSIGIGGHINPVDELSGDVLIEGLRREVEEELRVEGPLKLHVAGVINDDATAVGAVHFGLAVVARTRAAVAVRETDKMVGELTEVAALRALYQQAPDRFETWSAFLIEHLDAVLAADIELESVLARSGGGPAA